MKYGINVCEKVELNHALKFKAPDGADIEKILDKAEQSENLQDVIYHLKSYGCEIIETVEDGSGEGSIEINDFYDVKNEA